MLHIPLLFLTNTTLDKQVVYLASDMKLASKRFLQLIWSQSFSPGTAFFFAGQWLCMWGQWSDGGKRPQGRDPTSLLKSWRTGWNSSIDKILAASLQGRGGRI